MDETRLGQQVEIWIGREAISAERHTNTAGQEIAERMRRMAECSVRARAVDDSSVGGEEDCWPKVVTVGEQDGVSPAAEAQDVLGPLGQTFRIPYSQLLKEWEEWAG